jgi:hypothetical protein
MARQAEAGVKMMRRVCAMASCYGERAMKPAEMIDDRRGADGIIPFLRDSEMTAVEVID